MISQQTSARFLRGFLWFVVVAIGSAQLITLVIGSQQVGLSWDEHEHLGDLFNRETSNSQHKHFGIYGISYQLVGHLFAVIFAGEALGTSDYATFALVARHLASVLFILIASAVTGLIVYLVTNSRLIAAWGTIAVLSIPAFLGHGMFNPKDISIAAGYTLVTFGCVLWLDTISRYRCGALQSAVIVFSVAAGLWMAIGTRYVFLLVLTFSVLASVATGVVFQILPRFQARKYSPWWASLSLVAGWALGMTFLYLTNPCLLIPIENQPCTYQELLGATLSGSTSIASSQTFFLFGETFDTTTAPISSLGIFLVAGMPIGLLGLGILGMIVVGIRVLKKPRSDSSRTAVKFLAFSPALLIPVAIQMFALPTLTALRDLPIYDAQRQHLYFYPALIVFAGVGIAYLGELLLRGTPIKGRALVFTGIFCLSLLIPFVEGLRLFPYNYVYVNPVATMGGFSKNWETDYWAVSLREAMRKVPPGEQARVVGPFHSASKFVGEQGLESVTPAITREFYDPRYVVQMRRLSRQLGAPLSSCDVVDVVTRDFRGESAPMSYVLVCEEVRVRDYPLIAN